MKYLLLLLSVTTVPGAVFAHDGAHTEPAWYLSIPMELLISIAAGAIAVLWYSITTNRKKFFALPAAIALAVTGILGTYQAATSSVPVSKADAATLEGVPVTLYRVDGCNCCSGYARELEATGADVTVETIASTEMETLKNKYGISADKASCHTMIVDDYVVEGHVPFPALSKLVSEQPDVVGITLPGMPIGTPGMPGRQSEVYMVTTLDNELFWQSS